MSESQRRRLYVAAKGLLRAVSDAETDEGLRNALEEVHCEIALALEASPKTPDAAPDLETICVW